MQLVVVAACAAVPWAVGVVAAVRFARRPRARRVAALSAEAGRR